MSQVYSTEPPTTGRVVLQTSHGPIDINLWCKECPTTTRLFLQLCTDGFYDGIIFHRILDDFLIQCGSHRQTPSPSSSSSSSAHCTEEQLQTYIHLQNPIPVPLQKKKLELSPRIRFNHRGQVALALPLDDADASSSSDYASLAQRQFFVTLDEAPFLDAKHVIFGTVTGATIFNAIRIGKTETGEDGLGSPVDLECAPVVKEVKVDFHPFGDIVQTRMEDVPWKAKRGEENGKDDIKKRRKRRKGKRDLNVLSFGGEIEEEDDDENLDIGTGIHSSHDTGSTQKQHKDTKDRDRGRSEKKVKEKAGTNSKSGSNNKQTKDEKLERSDPVIDSVSTNIEKNIEPLPPNSSSNHSNATDTNIKPPRNASPSPSKIPTKKQTKPNKTSPPTKKMSAIELRRSKYLNRSKDNTTLQKGSKKRDAITMSKLSAFSSKMLRTKSTTTTNNNNETTTAPNVSRRDNSLANRMIQQRDKLENGIDEDPTSMAYAGQVLEDDGVAEGDGSWLRTKFECKRYTDDATEENGVGGDGRNVDDYDIIDGRGRKGEYGGKRRRGGHHDREGAHRSHGRGKR